MSREDVFELIEKMAKLQEQRAGLQMQKFKAKGRESIDAAISTVDAGIAKVGGRVARAYEKSEERKEAKEKYQAALTDINSAYEAEYSKIIKQIEKFDALEMQAKATVGIRNKILNTLNRNAGKVMVDKDMSPEDRIAVAESQLAEQKAAIESKSNQVESYNKIIERAKDNKSILNDRLKALEEERDKKLADLSKDVQLVKQSPFSRFLGMFGNGAKKKVEAIEQGISDRTMRAIGDRKTLNQSIEENRQAREGAEQQIIDTLKSDVRGLAETSKATVLATVDRTKEVGEGIRDLVSSAFEAGALHAKAGMQHAVANLLNKLNDFAQGQSDTLNRIEANKEKGEVAKAKIAGNKEKDALGEI